MFKIKLTIQRLFQKSSVNKYSEKVGKQVDTASIWWIATRMLLKLLILVFFGAIVLFPFYYMIAVSLMGESTYQSTDAVALAPKKMHWGNFTDAFQEGYWDAILYSFAITAISVVLKLVVTIMMGYAFSLKQWIGKKILWTFFLGLMFLPEVALLSGQYKMMVNLNWHTGANVIIGLFVPFVASVFSAIMFRNAFMQIPDMTKKAAMIDGATGAKYFFKVALPMITPTIWTVSILTSFAAWNSYMWPALLLQGQDIQTVPTWVFTTGRSKIADDSQLIMTVRMAGTVLAVIPMFLVFIVMRGRIMKAISRQGNAIKG